MNESKGEMRESVVIQSVIDISHTVDELWFQHNNEDLYLLY